MVDTEESTVTKKKGINVNIHIEPIQAHISQQYIVNERPLASAIMKTIPIALPWEIDPFRVPELVPHEIKIPFTLHNIFKTVGRYI
jgi:hypothetical protein